MADNLVVAVVREETTLDSKVMCCRNDGPSTILHTRCHLLSLAITNPFVRPHNCHKAALMRLNEKLLEKLLVLLAVQMTGQRLPLEMTEN